MTRIASTFLCALTVVQALSIQKPRRTDAVNGFIGSATCAWCHKTQAEKQSASSMARAHFALSSILCFIGSGTRRRGPPR